MLRAGRAGYMSAGQCYRLYSIETFDSLIKDTPPTICNSVVANAALYLKLLNVPDIRHISYLSAPSETQILQVIVFFFFHFILFFMSVG